MIKKDDFIQVDKKSVTRNNDIQGVEIQDEKICIFGDPNDFKIDTRKLIKYLSAQHYMLKKESDIQDVNNYLCCKIEKTVISESSTYHNIIDLVEEWLKESKHFKRIPAMM